MRYILEGRRGHWSLGAADAETHEYRCDGLDRGRVQLRFLPWQGIPPHLAQSASWQGSPRNGQEMGGQAEDVSASR